MILDLFAGPGGWSEGLALCGRTDLGIEYDLSACQTRAAAGHATLRADVAAYPTDPFGSRVEGLIASPPCPDFSTAGKRAGITGKSGKLMLEVPRWVAGLRPRWVACEQVPPALEWYEVFAHEFRLLGYQTWTGILNAADYGVPQTRQRAFLLASLDRQPTAPRATHARSPQPVLFGEEELPWVSMAEALGWVPDSRTQLAPDDPDLTLCGKHTPRWMYPRRRVGFPRLDDRGDSEDGYRERDWRYDDEPAFALTEKARSWRIEEGVVQTGNNCRGNAAHPEDYELYERPVTEPSPTLDAKVGGAWRVVGVNTGRAWKKGGTREDAQTVSPDDLAPAIDGKGRWHAQVEADASPSDAIRPDYPVQGTDAIRLGIADALVLQSFRPDYPVQGTKTKQFEQVGNSCPPRMMAHILAQFVCSDPEQKLREIGLL